MMSRFIRRTRTVKIGDSNMSTNKSECPDSASNSVHMRDVSSTAKIVIVLFMITISLTTVLFNIVIIVRIFWKSKHKTFTKFFLISLACVDLLVGLVVMPFSIYSSFYDSRWLLGDSRPTCDLANSLDVMFSVASIIHLTLLSFERYMAICRPFQYSDLCNRKTMLVLSTCCWSFSALFSFGLILPGYHMLGVEHLQQCLAELEMTCVFVVNVYYATVGSTVTIGFSGIAIVCCNIKVMTRVREYRAINRSSFHGNEQTSESRSMRVAKTIATLTACFLVCWAPFEFCHVLNVFMDYAIPDYIILTVTWLGYINSAANPILYILLEGKNCIGRR